MHTVIFDEDKIKWVVCFFDGSGANWLVKEYSDEQEAFDLARYLNGG